MPSPRRRNAVATRTTIITAAHSLFAQHGYERTTIRRVAELAGIDPALVMRYFGSKQGLFVAAAGMNLEPPDLTGVAPDRVADLLIPMFVRAWGPQGPLMGLLRAAASNHAAAAALRTLFTDTVAPMLRDVATDRHVTRAGLIGSHLVGIAVARQIIGTPPLVEMTDAELTEWLRPVIYHYLTTPAPRKRGTRWK